MRKILFLLLLCSPVFSVAQKNALGISVGYSYFQNKTWNALQDTYHQTLDTIQDKHPYLHHLPGASLIYERQLAEYLYAQPFVQYQYASTTSENGGKALVLKAHFLSAGLAVNWYPVKMAKGLKKTLLNPLYLRAGIGVNYSLNSIRLDNKVAYDDSTQSARSANLTVMAEMGFGYDLHFGKRLVVQPFFGMRVFPNMAMQSMTYFIDRIKRYDQEDTGLALEATVRISMLILF